MKQVFTVKNFDRIPLEVRGEVEHSHYPARGWEKKMGDCEDGHHQCRITLCGYCMVFAHMPRPFSEKQLAMLKRFLKAANV